MNARTSLRRTLLLGILLPLLALVVVDMVSLYRQALRSADTGYGRTLLASAKSIGEPPGVSGSGNAALVDFYADSCEGQPVRVAVLLQPVAGLDGRGMATIQVAEQLELRQTRARQILIETFWRQAALVAQVAAVVVPVVQRATRPVRESSAHPQRRGDADAALLTVGDAGGGICEARRQRLFQPFAPGSPDATGRGGARLGPAICADIADSLGGRISQDNCLHGGRVVGLDAPVHLPLADNGGQ